MSVLACHHLLVLSIVLQEQCSLMRSLCTHLKGAMVSAADMLTRLTPAKALAPEIRPSRATAAVVGAMVCVWICIAAMDTVGASGRVSYAGYTLASIAAAILTSTLYSLLELAIFEPRAQSAPLPLAMWWQVIGWTNPKEKFVFHYYLQHPGDNKLVVQRGRFAKWDWGVVKALAKRIRGN